MRRVERIIERIRRETENEEFGENYGISDEEMVDYLNDAQDRVYAEVVKTHPKFFMKEFIGTAPVNVEKYDLPNKIYLGQISLFEFSSTGNQKDYYRLKQALLVERLSYPIGWPQYYILRNKHVLFAPTPGVSSGTLRISYVEKLPKLDIRRATIASVTTTVDRKITSLFFSTSETLDRDELLKENYFCVVDKDGDNTMLAIPFTDIDVTTGEVTVDPNFQFEEGESISVGDYAVRGEYTANRSLLQDITERYLASHLRMEVLDRDSNQAGTQSQQAKMQQLLSEIVASFADKNDDIYEVAMLDPGYLLDDNFY